MIIDLRKFIAEEREFWHNLESILDSLERQPDTKLTIEQVKQFHDLYHRASADLARIMTFSAEPAIRHYLESLVSRAYGEIHETTERQQRFNIRAWLFGTLPQTFRRHFALFMLSLAIMIGGGIFGGIAVGLDSEAKEVILAYPHLQVDPTKRVAFEEESGKNPLDGQKVTFSSYLMTHNIKVSILTMALGMTFGVGTVILLFSNGVLLGAVIADYILAGQAAFLAGWLLPHGAVEIPAILIAGQAGLLLASAIIGWKGHQGLTMKARLKYITSDLVTLIGGVALMLVWAGVIEGFLSQYHEPVLPYEFKIGLGIMEIALLIIFFTWSGVKKSL